MKIIVFLVLFVIPAFSNGSFFDGISREGTGNVSSVPSSITASSHNTLEAVAADNRIDLKDTGRQQFQDFFTSAKDIIWLAAKLDQIHESSGVGGDEQEFYLRQLKEGIQSFSRSLNTSGEIQFLEDRERENVLSLLGELEKGAASRSSMGESITALETFLEGIRDRVRVDKTLLLDHYSSFDMERDEAIRMVLMDLHGKSCSFSKGTNCPSWSGAPGTEKDLKASFHVLQSLFGFDRDIHGGALEKDLDFRFEKLLQVSFPNRNYETDWKAFEATAMKLLDRYSQSPSSFSWMRHKLSPPDPEGKWKETVLAVLQKSKGAGSFARLSNSNSSYGGRILNAVFHPARSFSPGSQFKVEAAAKKLKEADPRDEAAKPEAEVQKTRKRFKDGTLYVGDVRNGLPDGKGMLVLPSGSRYIGEFAKGYYEGEGVLEYHTGSVYRGSFRKGDRQGKGTFLGVDGSLYRGMFDHNQANGEGSWILSDGTRYDGPFRDGVPHGDGAYSDTEGNRIEGEFKDGNLEGEVFFESIDHSGFLGEVNSDLEPHGEAWFFSPEGDAEASWEELEKEGDDPGSSDSLTASGSTSSIQEFDWELFGERCRYRGEFVRDFRNRPKPQGLGLMSCPSRKINGSFEDGKIQGHAVVDYKEGSLFTQTSGEYEENYLDGQGHVLYSDGRIYNGDWFLNDPARQWDGKDKSRSGVGRWLTEETAKACEHDCYIGSVVNRLQHGPGIEIHGPKTSLNTRIRRYEGGFKADTDGGHSWVYYGFCQVLFKDGGSYSGTVFPGSAGKYGTGVLKDKDGKVIHEGKVDYSFRPVKDDQEPQEPDWASGITEVAGALSDGFVSIIKELTWRDALDITLTIIPLGKITKLYSIATAIYSLKSQFEEIQKNGLTEEAKAKIYARIRDTLIMIIAGKTLEKVGSKLMKLLKKKLKFKPKLPPLRQKYVNEVLGLLKKADKMRKMGSNSETIARALFKERNDLKLKYRDLTPSKLLKKIEERNLQIYGNKLGPTIEQLIKKGKTWDDIIISACKPGGSDLGF